MSAAITGAQASTYAPTFDAYKAYFKRVNDAGGMNGYPVEICPVPGEPGKSDAVKTWRFNGPLGTRTFTTESHGDRIYVDFGINQGRAQFVVPSGLLQEHPELVGGAFYAGAFGLPRPGSELQAWLIRPKEAR